MATKTSSDKTVNKTQSEELSFEKSMQELELIVQQLEKGDLPLEASLKEFERGIALARQSQKKLEEAEQRVKILLTPDDKTPLSDF